MERRTKMPFTEDEARKLLARGEGQYIEFKSLWDRSAESPGVVDRREVRDSIAEQAAAFANADGGTLVLGAEDDGAPTGHGYPEEAIEGFLATPERRIEPPLEVEWQRLKLEGAELLIGVCPLAPEAVMVTGNGFPYRVGDQVVRESQEVINDRKAEYRRVGFERRTQPEATLEDLDEKLIREFLSKTVIGDRKINEILQSYGLVVPRETGFAVTNAALLLFGRRPFARWHPRAGGRLFKVDGTSRLPGRKRNVTEIARVEPPLARAIPDLHSHIKLQIGRSEQLHDLFFREMPEYPEFAWQEAVVNAFAHREYAEQGREVEVWLFDDRMEVQSPGNLIQPVTLEALRKKRRVHASRNPLLARVLVDAGIMREEGEGIPRMHEEMENSFLHPPNFDFQGGSFVVTLRNTPIFEGPSPSWRRSARSYVLGRFVRAPHDGFSSPRPASPGSFALSGSPP